MSETPQLDTPLWKFSLAVYAGEGVQDECLALQERHSVDVNLLLSCAYMGAVEGVVLADADVAAAADAVREWHADVVCALRRARRALKPWEAADRSFAPQTRILRARVKAAELDAEKIEQGRLWEFFRARSGSWRRGDPPTALAANLRALLLHAGVSDGADPAEAAPHLMRAASAVARTQAGSGRT